MKYLWSDSYPIEFVLSEKLDKKYSVHTHTNHWIITVVALGNIELEQNGSKKTYACGDCFILSPNTPHALSLNKHARQLSLCIEKDWIFCDDDGFRAIRSYAEGVCRRFHIPDQYAKILLDLLKELHDADVFSDNAEIGDMSELALHMAGEPEEEYALDRLAEKLYLNKYQLIKKFKRELGLSPHQFLIQSRVRKAQRLLTREAAISDISAGLGFYDQSHFDKAFRKLVGISPIAYRNAKETLEQIMEAH